jgi:uroporphyrinogen-III synthase
VLGREFSEYVLGEGLDRDKLNVLIPRALKGDKKLTNILSQAKIKYVDMPLYDTVVEEAVLEKLILELEEFDAVTFASTMGVNLLCEALKKKDGMKSLRTKKIFCIGNETARALEGFGFFEYKVAKAATAQGLAKLVIDDI